MGHLNETCSNGEPAWTRYVENRTNWATSFYRMYRTAPIVMGECEIELPQSTPIRLLSPIYHEIGRSKYAFVQWGLRRGYVRLSQISKPNAGRLSVKEATAVQHLQEQVLALTGNASSINVAILQSNTAVFWANGVSTVATVKKYPKADFVLQAANGYNLLYVSHKSGANAGRFQQYSGISEESGAAIHKHPEVQAFYEYVASVINVNGRLPYTVSAPIRDPRLVGLAVFGPRYGDDFNEQNVNIMGQGTPVLVRYGDAYALSFDVEAAINGKLDRFMADTSEYRAMLVAFPSSKDRSFKRHGRKYTHVRLGIYPNAFLKGRK